MATRQTPLEKRNQVVLRRIYYFIGIQMLMLVVISSFFWLMTNQKTAYSIVVGGLICLLPYWYFARSCFSHSGAQQAKRIMRAFYWGELLKFLITVVLFILVIKLIPVNFLALFVGYCMAYASLWFVPLILLGK